MLELTEDYIASVARTLNEAGIPCLLWGHYLLVVHGVPTIVASIDFVVPDDLVNKAIEALYAQQIAPGLELCEDTRTCLESCDTRPTQAPTEHLHLTDSELVVGIFAQRETLWGLPPLSIDIIPPRPFDDTSAFKESIGPDFVLASDDSILPPWRPGRGHGVLRPDLYPIVIPAAHRLLEAYIRLRARLAGSPPGGFSMSNICYMVGYVDEDGFLDERLLVSPIRELYRRYKNDEDPVRKWTENLKEALGEAPYPEEVDDLPY